MSLNFNKSFATPPHVVRRAQDDLYLRGPVLLANALTNPLTMPISPELLSKTWRLVTVGKDVLQHGPRFENALWRKWAQYKFARARFPDSGIEWDYFMGGFTAPFVPLVISDQTCHHIQELPLARSYQYDWAHQVGLARLSSPRSVALEATAMDSSLSLSIRSCLKGSTMTNSSDSPLSLRSTISGSPNVRAKRTITFNSYVSQSIILDTPSFRGDACGCVVSDDALSDDELGLLRSSRGRRSRSRSSICEQNGDQVSILLGSPISSSATLKQGDFAAIQALPPAELFPPPRQDELDNKIVFVPPNGADAIGEHDLLRSGRVPPTPKLKRTMSSRDLSIQKQNLELENALIQVGATSGDAALGDNDQGSFIGGGMQTSRRMRRKRASFSTGNDDDGEDKDQDWIVVQTTIAARTGLEVVSSELGDGKVCLMHEILARAESLSEKGARGGAKSPVEKNAAGARNGVETDVVTAVRIGSRGRKQTNHRDKAGLGDKGVSTKEGGTEASIDGISKGVKGRAEDIFEEIGGEGVMVEGHEEASSGSTNTALLLLVAGGVAGVGAWLGF